MAKKNRKINKTISKKAKKHTKRNIPANIAWWKNKTAIVALLAILLLTLLAYFPSLQNDFTNWDDDVYVLENPVIVNLSFENIKQMFKETIAINYHPITLLSLAIDYQLHQINPFGYHLTNLLLHLFNTCFVFWFVFLITKLKEVNSKIMVAGISALLFAIHPLHVESVAWIAERKDVLYTFFFLLGLINYTYYLAEKKSKQYILTFLFFTLSILSKPAAVVFPIVLFALDFWLDRKWENKVVIDKIPFLLLSVVIGIVTIKAQSATAIGAFEAFSIFDRIMFAAYGFVMYIFKFFVPIQLSAFYPYPELGTQLGAKFFVAFLAALAILGGVVWSLKKTKLWAFSVAFYAINVALVLQFVSVGNSIISERYTYIPYIGLAFGIAYFFVNQWNKSNKQVKPILMGVLGLYAIFCLYQTFQQTKVWKNSDTLWSNVIDKFPESSTAYNNRGDFYVKTGQLDKAFKDLSQAITLKPDHHEALTGRGNIFYHKQNYQRAIQDYNKAITINKDYYQAFNNRGSAYVMLNDLDKALADFAVVTRLKPDHPSVFNNTASIYHRQGKLKEAVDSYSRAIALQPTYGEAYKNRSIVYKEMGNKPKALQDIQQAQRLGENISNDYLQGLR